jgi:hypothetical protein
MCLYGQLNVGSILSCSECALNVFQLNVGRILSCSECALDVFIWTVECGKYSVMF